MLPPDYETGCRRSGRADPIFRRALTILVVGSLAIAALATVYGAVTGPRWRVIAWNNLGMHCMDDDYSVFSILPPFNTVDAQVLDTTGRLVLQPSGISVSYEAVADPDGSINTTSEGKTNFWEYAGTLFGATLQVDTGLTGLSMPGAANVPQPMAWNGTFRWFEGEGIPITPIDDLGRANAYPLMRIVVRDTSGAELASTNVVLPVSVEMDCRACHASSAGPAARPRTGWVNDPSPSRDHRLNILRLHDEQHLGEWEFDQALQTAGYNASGLFVTAMSGTPILCASCHASEALPGSGLTDISPLTTAMHAKHATVVSPANGLALDDAANRSSCYQCHPGSATRCLRGAMGAAVTTTGELAMECQSCHGNMARVGSTTRIGWLDEPNCQSCHTGTAISNQGQIRFTSAFDESGNERLPADARFATNPDTPAPGHSLYRFSSGHGGLQCSACHGSTHAIFPSSHRNDNIASFQQQGHVGTLAECAACHTVVPNTTNGGPHGMHPVGQAWVDQHHDYGKRQDCQACHGLDYRGTVLSRMFDDRTFTASNDGTTRTVSLQRGTTLSCFVCHLTVTSGPPGDVFTTNHAPIVAGASLAVPTDTPTSLTLSATDADNNSLSFRIVRQPSHGTVGLVGSLATYYPEAGFTGPDIFAFAAFDTLVESGVANISVTVGGEASLTADTDGDGLCDLLEYALGLSPFFPSNTGPSVQLEPTGGHDYLSISVPAIFRPSDVTLTAEVSGDLSTWSSEPTDITVLSDDPSGLKARDTVAVDASTRRFLRLNVTRSP